MSKLQKKFIKNKNLHTLYFQHIVRSFTKFHPEILTETMEVEYKSGHIYRKQSCFDN